MHRLPLVLLHCVALARFAAAGIFFTEQPIVRFSPALGVAANDLFGYSAVLHMVENSGDLDEVFSGDSDEFFSGNSDELISIDFDSIVSRGR